MPLFLTNLLVSLSLFAASFAVSTYVLPGLNDSDYSTIAVSIINTIATIILLAVSLVFSSCYGWLYKKKTSYFFKRMIESIFIIIAAGFAVTLIAGAFSDIFVDIIAVRINHPYLSKIIKGLPLFIVYLICAYKIFFKFGYKQTSTKTVDLGLHICTVIYSYVIIISFALNSGLYNIMSCHTVFCPYVPEDNQNKYVNTIIIILLVTFAVEIFVSVIGYGKGKKHYIKKYGDNEVYEVNLS